MELKSEYFSMRMQESCKNILQQELDEMITELSSNAMFFMDTASLEYLKNSAGFELGVGPSIVVVDEGMAKTMTTSTAQKGIYAFIFS